jgi:hypothetical protein
MMKKANEETASVVKKATEEAASIVKKANDEADDILAKANAEKEAVMAETEKCKAALAENADKQIRDIKNNITQQKSIINSFNKEYKAMVDKYIKAYDPQVCADLIKDLDDIDGLVSDWAKNGIPDVVGTPKKAETTTHNPSPLQQQLQKAGVNVTMPKVEEKREETKVEEDNGVMPSPLTASSVASAAPQTSDTTEEETKSEAPKNFIKTGLAGNGGMAGIPANPSYGLGGERTLKNSVNHSETKTTESAPEPVSAANITVPKFGATAASDTTTSTATSSIPAFASALSNNSASTASSTADVKTDTAAAAETSTQADVKAEQKPGIYKVSADNKLYNDNNSSTSTGTTATPVNAVGSAPRAMGGMGLAPSSSSAQNNNVPKPGIYKIGADNKLTNSNAGYAPKAEQTDAANTANTSASQTTASVSSMTGMSKPGIYKVTDQQ